MITLKTGVPGSGKTLTAVHELMAVFASENPRAVYVHGIPDLALACLPLPVFSVVGKRNALEVDWSVIPAGALVVIDEAQHIFPLRAAGSHVPSYVAFLNTHRHRGIDIVLITQSPKLIDAAVRPLVGKHQFYRRIWGGLRHIRYEWDYCDDGQDGLKLAAKSAARFPRKAFSAYKSAEVHTKQKFQKPAVLLLPVVALGVLAWIGPKGYDAVMRQSQPKTASPTVSAEKGEWNGLTPQQAAAKGTELAARNVAALPAGVEVRRKTWPAEIAGCWIDSQCVCMTNGSRPRRVTDLAEMCVAIATGRLDVDPGRPAPKPAVEEVKAERPAAATSGATHGGGMTVAAAKLF